MRNPREQTYNQLRIGLITFLTTFRKDGILIYKLKAEELIHRTQRLLLINAMDFMEFSIDLWDIMAKEYHRNERILNQVFTNYMRDLERNIKMGDDLPESKERNDFYVGFDGIYGDQMRQLSCDNLGMLTAFRGTVTRTTEVRPELVQGVFMCMGCHQHSSSIEQQFKYTEPKNCRSLNCASNKWELIPGLSQFADFQKIRVQDDPSELPQGGMPRSMEVILRNELCDMAQPGDNCVFAGSLCVAPQLTSLLKPGERTQSYYKNAESKGNGIGLEGVVGLTETGVRDLNYKLLFMASSVKVQNQQFKYEIEVEEEETNNDDTEYSDEKEFKKIFELVTPSFKETIKEIINNPNKYDALAESLFPAIYGNTEIKKAILLQMFSGVHKTAASNKISIRGDINILIVGDPSTAKSMFLKSVQNFVPRSVYTNGKTTSAAGLTATVTRDENGDVGLEAGALMLADNGVCCIDEFDKMEIKDQVAIHEAMQQQTISIAKAGIYATLNARTSILAAANPLFGRYDKTKALKHNINLSAPIMSRFDLFFVICDEPDAINDTSVGDFIISMHRNQEKAMERTYQVKDIREYIRLARKIKPRLTTEAGELLRKCYSKLREKDKNSTSTYRVTVRQLESMIRLSEALARLHLSFEVTPEHVQEAYRLTSLCIVKLEKSFVQLEQDEIIMQFSNMNLDGVPPPGQNLAQRQMRKIQKPQRRTTYSISFEIYSQLQNTVIQLFNAKEKEVHNNPNVDDEPVGIEQGDVVDYLISQNLDGVESAEHLEKSKRIIASVIRKLVDDERILLVFKENDNVNKRVLYLHPNYIN